ncbi:hypothetical protein MBLNU457_6023t1 [Dothideomycetes sp. NU457]
MRFPSVTVATLLACATVAQCVDVNSLPGFKALHSGPKDKYAEDNAAYAAAYDEYDHAMVERDAYRYRRELLPRWFRHRPEIPPRDAYEERSVDVSHEAMDYAHPLHDRDFSKRYVVKPAPVNGHALAQEHALPSSKPAPKVALPTHVELPVKPKLVIAKPVKTQAPKVPIGHGLAESRPLPVRSVEDHYHGAGHIHHTHHRPSFGVYARSTEEHGQDYDYEYAPYTYDEYDYENEEYYYYPDEDAMDFRTDMPSAHEYEMASALQSEHDHQFGSYHGSAVPGAHATVSSLSSSSSTSTVASPSPAMTPAPSTPTSTAGTAPPRAATPMSTSSTVASKAVPVPQATTVLKARAAPAATPLVSTASKTFGVTIARMTDFVKNMYEGIKESSEEAERKVKEGLDYVV